MDDSKKSDRLSTRKPEIVQAGLRVGGSLNFKNNLPRSFEPRLESPQSYRVYKFVPEQV
jgi:hypothetical protein